MASYKVVRMFDLGRVGEGGGSMGKMGRIGKRDLMGLEMLEEMLLHYGLLVKSEVRARLGLPSP